MTKLPTKAQLPQNSSEDKQADDLPLLNNGVVTAANDKQTANKALLSQTRITQNTGWKAKVKWLPLFILVFAVGGFVGLYFQPPGLQFLMHKTGLSPGAGTSHPIALPIPRQDVVKSDEPLLNTTALGTVLPASEMSILAPPFGSSDARVAQLYVKEGEHVTAGQLIASMDNLASLEASLESAIAEQDVAQAQLQQTKFSLKNARAVAQAELEKVKANYEQAKSDLARGKVLKQDGVITQSELDKFIANEASLGRGLDSARANLNSYDYSNIDEHPEVKLALSNLQAAQRRVSAKQQDVSGASLRAPANGVILEINTRLGERPGDSGIAVFGDTEKMQVKLEVYQSDIQFVSIGAKVLVRSAALGGRVLEGHVSRIGLEVKKQQLVAQSPAANTDARVVIVNVELEPESSSIAAGFTGLEVLGSIVTTSKQ